MVWVTRGFSAGFAEIEFVVVWEDSGICKGCTRVKL